MPQRPFRTFITFTLLASSALASPPRAPVESVASLGDSMTAAAFGGSRRQDGVFPWAQAAFLKDLFAYLLTKGNPLAIERKRWSWATGRDSVNSHARRLARLMPRGGRSLLAANFAVTGALAADVERDQVEKMFEWSERRLDTAAPDYVIMLVGANDLCGTREGAVTPTHEYYNSVHDTAERILSRAPKTKILLASPPSIDQLHDKIGPAKLFGGGFAKTCRDLWKITKVCSRVTGNVTPDDLALVAAQAREYYEAGQEAVHQLQSRFGDRVRFAPQVYQTEFNANDMAIDCFHPGREGQRRLSEQTWKATWWADNG